MGVNFIEKYQDLAMSMKAINNLKLSIKEKKRTESLLKIAEEMN